MSQKIVSIGNSVGVIIPKAILKELELKHGSEVEIELDSRRKNLIITKKGHQSKFSIDPHFLEIIQKVNDEFGPALKELAKK